jgi:integrase
MAVWKLPKLPSGRDRNKPYRAKVKGKVQDFPTKKDAEHWHTQQLSSYSTTGLPLTIDALRKVSVGEIIVRYLREKTPLKGSAASETILLEKLLGFKKGARDPKREQHPICGLSLAAVKRTNGFAYRDERLKTVTQGSAKREFATLRNIFEVAKEEWGYANLINPFHKMGLRENPGRARLLKPRELERLELSCKACRGNNRYYVPLAMYLAIETGMRLQETFNLTWEDVDIANRRITIGKSKTDHKSHYKGRTIVMSYSAFVLLAWLRVNLYDFRRHSEQDRIFPMTKEAFKQSWRDAVKRAGIKDLQFRDLRHVAGTAFDKAGLTKAEHDLMMGHGKRTMRDLYIHADLSSIQDKLDRHQVRNKSSANKGADEVASEVLKIPSTLSKAGEKIRPSANDSGQM